jgi:hypothetical protein
LTFSPLVSIFKGCVRENLRFVVSQQGTIDTTSLQFVPLRVSCFRVQRHIYKRIAKEKRNLPQISGTGRHKKYRRRSRMLFCSARTLGCNRTKVSHYLEVAENGCLSNNIRSADLTGNSWFDTVFS